MAKKMKLKMDFAVAQNSMAAALQKAGAALTSLPSEIHKVTLPIISQAQIEELEIIAPDKKHEFESLLAEITICAKELRGVYDDAQKRSEEIARKEDAFLKKSNENKIRTEEIVKLDDELKQQQIKLKKLESALLSKERDIEQRELDARSGFAAQNHAALNDLKEEIAELESKRIKIKLNIHQTEQKALDDETERSTKLIEREVQIATEQRRVQQDRSRLDAEWKELDHERTQISEDALRTAAQEIARHEEAHQTAKKRLRKVYEDWTLAEQRLEEFREFNAVLAGRPARELLDELTTEKTKRMQLENQLASNQDDQLKTENDALRRIRDELKAQLDEVHVEFADVKAQLHRLRLGVSDKESLEKEKRTLEKHNQILKCKA